MKEGKKKLAWLILARLVVVSLFLAAITYLNLKQPTLFTEEMLRGVTILIIVTYCFSILSLTAFGLPDKYQSSLAYAQIIWEILFVSILVILTGGITSTYAFFYNLAIINASFLFARREALYTSSLCGIIYGAIIDFHYYGHLTRFGLVRDSSGIYDSHYILLILISNLIAFFLTAILTGYLAERASKSELELRKIEIDFSELERLNSMIVSTLDSGLITVNESGRIRVFNRTASRLTGYDQLEAYDKYLQDVIPESKYLLGLFNSDLRSDMTITAKSGERKVFSIKSAPFADSDGNRMGAVIDFYDVTRIRDMENQLKRADKLAAIGELAARIAHEVRNPLASISGSVELISQSASVHLKDKKLLEIVLRETERLDKLLGDFLQYARPKPPDMIWFSIEELISEVMQLLQADKRFESIKFMISENDDFQIFADRDQIRQVILNLLINAAEACCDDGIISLDYKHSAGPVGLESAGCLEISISDNGSGISDKNFLHIFEPFFTTKPGGSGIGLAMVYRIVESHGGNIEVENRSEGGACFRFNLPLTNYL